MSWIMVDAEATLSDKPCPGCDSIMTELGAVLVSDPSIIFYADFTQEHPVSVITRFADWIFEYGGSRPMFISDNNGFDWGWVNYYFWIYLGFNPFGHSSTNLGSLYKGMVKDTYKNFKHLRKTKHTHHPVDDAMGNVEALIYMRDKMGLQI